MLPLLTLRVKSEIPWVGYSDFHQSQSVRIRVWTLVSTLIPSSWQTIYSSIFLLLVVEAAMSAPVSLAGLPRDHKPFS